MNQERFQLQSWGDGDRRPRDGGSSADLAARYAQLAERYERATRMVAKRAEHETVVVRLGERLLKAHAYEETFDAVLADLRDTLRVDFCEVFQVASDRTSLVLCAANGWPHTHVGRYRVHATSGCEAGFAFTSAEPVVIANRREDRRFAEWSVPEELGVQCGVSVAIPGPKGAVGVLGAHACASRDFTREDIHFQQSVAILLGSALERLRGEREREQLLARTAAARESAEQASEVKTRFLGMMSHELRTPLNAIGGYVELLAGGLRGPINAEQREDLARIARNQRYVLGLIENALSYLKLEHGKVSYEIRDLSAADVIASVDDMIRPLTAAKSIVYEHRVSDAHLTVAADREKLQQILVNLLANAAKFTTTGGRILLDCSAGPDTVRFLVCDTGPGMPADRLHGIFEPFAQLRGTGEPSVPGTGLGLSISREFALGMGGNLVACSELGHGSTFALLLPRHRDASIDALPSRWS
jgi:signal transduction histidine kinase